MTGRELIEQIERNGNLDDEIQVVDPVTGKFLEIVNVDRECKRDPYDQDFDRYVNVINVSND